MPQDSVETFRENLDVLDTKQDIFAGLRENPDEKELVSGLRRARRSVANAADGPVKTVSLVEENGILCWHDDLWAAETPANLGMGVSRRRRRRRAGLPAPATESQDVEEPAVATKTFTAIKPNKIIDAIGKIDRYLNPAIGEDLRSKMRQLLPDGSFGLVDLPLEPIKGRTLLFVHGTFSNATNMLGEFNATDDGKTFLRAVLSGPKKYQRVVFFEHPTLVVSPVINALELGRAFAGTSGQIDVIAHSRGGLIVRWWLEAFGKSLAVNDPIRAVLVGSPIGGTSLAAPDKLKGALDLVTNIGRFAGATLNLVGGANPFLWAAGKLVEVATSAVGVLANSPVLDGAVAIIPGLAGQSLVTNNLEIQNLRIGPCAVTPKYFAVQSNFEAEDISPWQFWKFFRKEQLADAATNRIFPGGNDLVVDTDSMIDFGVAGLAVTDKHDFKTNAKVWHCNYFRQQETIEKISTKWLI